MIKKFIKNPLVREYLWSAFVTFAAAFVGAFVGADVPASGSALFALVCVAFREGGKAVLNLAVTKGKTISSK